eukprot:CAMPEP_0194492084 /NCGR_PEP_ID=MMETSP0253-20130528/10760_1 /TAXON_ID=2966 /ORGANISM="Noctiluca scintillans" /LENGTH=119 /DNA_ID=CAMNT_0039332903 /DNA_START=28 /DNA_END=388 /DNA_ORIENTATION=-
MSDMSDSDVPAGDLFEYQLGELMFREIGPEDYDVLSQLDDAVPRPTASQEFVDSLPSARKKTSSESDVLCVWWTSNLETPQPCFRVVIGSTVRAFLGGSWNDDMHVLCAAENHVHAHEW